MKGGYDLHGNYYPNKEDAINAEMAQCAEIGARHDRQEVRQVQDNMQTISQYLADYDRRIKELELKVSILEAQNKREVVK